MKVLFIIVLMGLSSIVNAGVVKVKGNVIDIWLFTDTHEAYNAGDIGLATIYLDSPLMRAACGRPDGLKRVAISTDHPLYQSVVSMALMAKQTGRKVELWHLETCSLRSNSWDFALIRFADQPENQSVSSK